MSDRRVLSESPRVQKGAAEPIAGQGTDPNKQRGEAVPKAITWLRARGAGGERLLALAKVLSADPADWDQRIRRKGEQIVVLFPDGLASLGGTPQASLDALARNGLLDVNPLAPLRRVIEIDGKHGASLTLEVSRQLLALIDDHGSSPEAPAAEAPSTDRAPLPAEGPTAQPLISIAPNTGRRNAEPADPDPARALVERIRARDLSLPGGVSRADGWFSINQAAVRAWARDRGVQPYVLIRTLGHLPGCRVTPDGGLMVREES